jgi:hypothetical protein
MKGRLTIKAKSNKLFFHRLMDNVEIDDMKRFSIQANIYRKIIVKDEALELILISLLFTVILVFNHM